MAAVHEFFNGVDSVDFTGLGVSYTSAAQGALVFREALRLPTAGYETYQYLHGPMVPGRAGTGLVLFGDGHGLGVVASQAQAGVKVLVVSATDDEQVAGFAHENVRVLRVPESSTEFERVIAETVAIHVETEAIAARRAITIEEFLYDQPDTSSARASRRSSCAAPVEKFRRGRSSLPGVFRVPGRRCPPPVTTVGSCSVTSRLPSPSSSRELRGRCSS